MMSSINRALRLLYLVSLFALNLNFPIASASENPSVNAKRAWEAWYLKESRADAVEVLPNIIARQKLRSGRFQFALNPYGVANRADPYSHTFTQFSGRYFFSESWAWEVVRVTRSWAFPWSLTREIEEKTDLRFDVAQSGYQVSSGVMWSPFYGKLALGERSIWPVSLDFVGALGVRLGGTTTPYFETGAMLPLMIPSLFGLDHRVSMGPEYRLRIYSEARTAATLVWESQFSWGLTCLF